MKQMKYDGEGCISMHHFTQYCPVLPQESALFMDQASSILRTLSRVVSSFSDEQQQLAARRIQKTHRPQHISTSLRKHDSVTHNSPVMSNKQLNTLPLVSLEAQLLFFLLPIILKKYHLSFVCLWLFLAPPLAYKWHWTFVIQSLNVHFSISWNTDSNHLCPEVCIVFRNCDADGIKIRAVWLTVLPFQLFWTLFTFIDFA